jgi:hypothetical protein
MSSLLLLCTPAPYRVRLTGRPGLNRSVPAWRPKPSGGVGAARISPPTPPRDRPLACSKLAPSPLQPCPLLWGQAPAAYFPL